MRGAGGGLFTSTNPETRRIMPEFVGSRTRLKVVYVVLEAQYQSALGAAVRNINATNDKARLVRLPRPRRPAGAARVPRPRY